MQDTGDDDEPDGRPQLSGNQLLLYRSQNKKDNAYHLQIACDWVRPKSKTSVAELLC
ncbi:hypothetical protein VIBHAR_01164 [Vibrio campbellii ATCC BAA-1116]|uniref:Uncharacterized protein n=1 Tax=Vibrio campbellii (strain ATCC BAA-1116) TaxID=2902295 RepID=A7MWU2_VIBC1|nr:hypothetical protein VIBHAR_01164 [Vibrio campbellii ATCC BAA-1116]